MSNQELGRMLVLDRVIARTLTQRTTAELLAMSDRRVRRLIRAYGPFFHVRPVRTLIPAAALAASSVLPSIIFCLSNTHRQK